MSIDRNVRLQRGDGACFVCERAIEDPVSIEISFAVPMLITSVDVTRQMHISCAEELSELLRRRIRQARSRG